MARKRIPKLPFGRFLGPPLTIVLFLVVGYLAMTGRLTFIKGLIKDHAASDGPLLNAEGAPIQLTSSSFPGSRSPETLRIATFNIQVFGKSKAAKPDVMNYLAWIFRQFDVIAVQEIRSVDNEPVDQLLALVNASGDRYQMILSERLGRTDSKEQYAYFWDTSRVQLIENSAYLVDDSADFMHREPFVASFRGLRAADPSKQPFSFTMMNVHTDPDETQQELNVLDDVFQSVRAYEFSEDDFILVGDLNVEVDKFGELGQLQGVESLNREKTNTAGDRCIDHILIDRTTTTELRAAGVINYERDLNLTREQAELISDHRPVWAAFSISEDPQLGILAARPGTMAR